MGPEVQDFMSLIGVLPRFDSFSWTLYFDPGKKTPWSLNFSYGRRGPTTDFDIAVVHTSLCNVFGRTHTHNGSSRAELQAPRAMLESGWPGQLRKPFPTISL